MHFGRLDGSLALKFTLRRCTNNRVLFRDKKAQRARICYIQLANTRIEGNPFGKKPNDPQQVVIEKRMLVFRPQQKAEQVFHYLYGLTFRTLLVFL